MARYSPDHKEATRRRMIETAGRRFKSDGLDGSGIATLVADAGLTNGAFYAHFASKEDLVANVLADQLRTQRHSFDAQPADRAGLEAIIRAYLSPQHRDQYADGCPSAALLDEIARSGEDVREAYTEGARSMIEAIARHLGDSDTEAATQRAIGLFTLLVASLQLARAITDPHLSDHVLAAAYANAVTIATAPLHPAPPTGQESS